MSKTISLDHFPSQVESLLRTAWESHESIVLEQDGQPVAAVIPMEEYRRWRNFPDSTKMNARSEIDFSYQLPEELREAYHRLLDKKFDSGLTHEEEAELERLDQQLDEAELATPLVLSILSQASERDKHWLQTLDEVIAKLRELREWT